MSRPSAQAGDPAAFGFGHPPALLATAGAEFGGVAFKKMAVFAALGRLFPFGWTFDRLFSHDTGLYGLLRAIVNGLDRLRLLIGERRRPIDAAADIGAAMEAAGWVPMARSGEKKHHATLTLLQQCKLILPRTIVVEREHVFHAVRKWRLDFAIVALKIGLEIEGGLFQGHQTKTNLQWMAKAGAHLTPADVQAIRTMGGGRHSQPASMREDLIKYNEALVSGWIVIRVLPEMVEDGRAITWLEAAVKIRSQQKAS